MEGGTDLGLLGGAAVRVAYRVLSSGDEDTAIASGLQYAKDKGFADDEDLKEAGRVYKRVALAFVDPDDHTVAFFKGPEQVRDAPEIGRERAVYLNELQELWQDECCPSRLRMGDVEFRIALSKIAGADSPDPFVDLRPGLRWSFARTTARMLLDYLRLSAGSGTSQAASKPEMPPTMDEPYGCLAPWHRDALAQGPCPQCGASVRVT